MMGFRLLDILITSYLSGLNSIDQVDSHSSSLCRPDCKTSESDLGQVVQLPTCRVYRVCLRVNGRALISSTNDPS